MWAYQWTYFWTCWGLTPRFYEFSWEHLWQTAFTRAKEWWLWPGDEGARIPASSDAQRSEE